MPDPQIFHMDSPEFPRQGRPAAELFEQIANSTKQGLAENFLTHGVLHAPEDNKLRSEYIRFVYGHQKSLADTVQWIALRLDPLDFGRLIYEGRRPEMGEPSWREAGSVAMEWFVDNVRSLVNELEDISDHQKQLIKETVSFSVAIMGACFNHRAGARASDARFAHLRVSWIGTPEEPVSKPFAQTAILNALLSQLSQQRDLIIEDTTLRFQPGDHIFAEVYHQGLSDEEYQMSGLDKDQVQARLGYDLGEPLPDVVALDQERERDVAPTQFDVLDDKKFEECEFESDLPLILDEAPDLTALRDDLRRHKMPFRTAPREPEDFDRPKEPVLCEIHDGIRAILALKEELVSEEPEQALGAILEGLASSTHGSNFDHREYFRFSVNKHADLHSAPRHMVQVDVALPPFSEQTKAERHEIIVTLFGVCLEHRKWFSF